jgi:hypothetical protein
MHRERLLWTALALLAALANACGEGGGAASETGRASAAAKARGDVSSPAAVVDGETIGVDEVRALMDESDAGLTAEQAIDALIDEHLLAREAARRGVGGADVEVERERAMVRGLMDRIRDETTAASVDESALREDYDRQRERFVHGIERRVIHVVVRTGKRGMKDPAAAEALALRIRAAEEGVASEADFRTRAQPFREEAGKSLKIETLPPFAAESRQLAREFVAAAFAVPKIGGLSPAFVTSFGWHVLYVIEELPAEDVPFDEARSALAAERLPRERQRRLGQLLDRLLRENPVFVYETPAAAAE